MRFAILSATVLLMTLAPLVGAHTPEDVLEPQFPQKQNAGDLLRACTASRLRGTGRVRSRYCAGFVSGVEEAVRLLQMHGKIEHRVCTPPDISASALADVYVKYGTSHKGELPDPAVEVVLHALADAYPCAARP
jgi:hypothetical protein